MLLFTPIMGECLQEAKASVVRRTVNSKRAAIAGGSAMQIAKKRNPALFRLYTKHNLIRKQLKARINKQYGAMAAAAARSKFK